MNPLSLIDRMASLWLDWHTNWIIDHDPEVSAEWKMQIHSVEMKNKATEIVMETPAIAEIANQAAKFLEKNNAENYVQFDCWPRLDRGLKPVRITIQWAKGMSPGEKNRHLVEELALMTAERDRLLELLDESIDPNAI